MSRELCTTRFGPRESETELGNAGTSTDISDDMNLENELPVMDDDAFYTAYASDSDIGNSRVVPMVMLEYVDNGVVQTFF